MSDHIPIRITSDGVNTRVYAGDVDISGAVRSVDWSHFAGPLGHPEATIELTGVNLDVELDRVGWAGLAGIPTETLEVELQRRRADG